MDTRFRLDFETLIEIVKLLKRPTIRMSMLDLDNILTKYFEMKLGTIEEIKEFEESKANMYEISKK